MKNLILLSVFVGLSASVPVLIQSNPDLLRTIAKRVHEDDALQLSRVETAPEKTAAGPLSGRRHHIRIDELGHFRDEFRLNGRRTTAMVDTGATLVAINRSTARRIGIRLSNADFIYEVNTANGKTKAAAAVIDRVQVGRIEIDHVKAVVLDDKALAGTLIGMSFLKRLDSFQVRGNTLLLER
ncbi:MAG: TIGR02281 family clan AA aspartic protease [Zhengella sp.]|uniref:TIGR02281 family clan AA aspartic protease n=1 Tax=Zhengella sp. TaxID=2282762 RepID=UPI003529B68B|nr:TIGR02281 family clan AA aspartic protease [Brucellaceae bacterium]